MRLLILACLALLGACRSVEPANPSFPLSVADAQRDLAAMARRPRRLTRPLLVLGGWNDPGLAAAWLGGQLGRVTGDRRIVAVSFTLCPDFEACRRRVLDALDQSLAGQDPAGTAPVDVVAISMGGLVARYAALPQPGRPRLRIVNLFTIATPHRGAILAGLPTLDRLQIDMRPGSAFLQALDASDPADYALWPYARLDDMVVGAERAAPAGTVPWWVPNRFLHASHTSMFRDPRILADIARRLRGEMPYSTSPPAPLPAAGHSRRNEAAPP